MKYSSLKRIKRFLSRHLFRLFFSKSFKQFGKKVFIESPDIIEGEEYINLEDNVYIGSMCWLLAYKQDKMTPNIHISQGTTIGRFCHIVSLKNITIEKNVLIADKVYISDNIHGYTNLNLPIKDQPIEFKGEVVVGENSWIGENVSIIGAKIGKHCVIGANSFVNQDIPDYSIAVGTPAQVIRTISKKDSE